MTETTSWKEIFSQLLNREDLSVMDSTWAMNTLIRGEASAAEIAAFLIALKSKGESVGEIVGFRDAILANALPIELDAHCLDIVGTGGDRHGTVNVSTMASLVIAAAGVPMVKHGNRAASSQSGSSDVLAALGVNLDLSAEQIQEIFKTLGIAFIYAAKFHPGFGHVADVRRELGVPTVFNFLGPLCNPIRPIASAVGVADPEKAYLISEVFATRGATALVFRGDDGMDELTTTGHSKIWEISQGEIREHLINSDDFGFKRANLSDLLGGDAATNAEIARRVLNGESGPVRDIVVLNAAAGMTAFALANDLEQASRPIRERLQENIPKAAASIDSGAASTLLSEWASLSRSV